MPKILVGECKQEVSSFNPVISTYEDFDISVGSAILDFHRNVSSEMAGALRVSDVTSTLAEDGETLVAETSDLRLIGDVALRAGLPIWGLSPKQADLEDLFFALTEGTNRNLGPAAPRDVDAHVGEEGANE